MRSPDVIRLDASRLDGSEVEWQHYCGHLALLRFSEWIRSHLLNDAKRDPADDPAPDEPIVYQVGRILVRKVNEVPPGAEVYNIERDGPLTLEMPDGPYTIKPSEPPE